MASLMLCPHPLTHKTRAQLDSNLIQRFQTSPQFEQAKLVRLKSDAAAAILGLTQDFAGTAGDTDRGGGAGKS